MTPTALSPGSEFQGRYRVVRLIKAGGMGAVYEVVDARSNRPRALKVLLPSLVTEQNIRAKFVAEARVTSAIESEHLVEVFDAGVDEVTGAPFIVMELLRGEDLDALARRGPVAPPLVLAILGQVALALDKTHAAGIVHRDLKPENLFVTQRDDGTPRARILDFGIAKVVANASSAASRMIGTPMYMAPEQIFATSRVGPSADLYALGHIAYTLLVGRSYWTEEVASLDILPFLVLAAKGAPAPATTRAATAGITLPASFDAWFARATATSPDERFSSARAMIAALDVAVAPDDETLVAHPAYVQRAIVRVGASPSFSGAEAARPSAPEDAASRSLAGAHADRVVSAGTASRPPLGGTTPLGLPTVDRAALSHSQPLEPMPARRGPILAALAGGLVLVGGGLLFWQLRAIGPAGAARTSEPSAAASPARPVAAAPVDVAPEPDADVPSPVSVLPMPPASASVATSSGAGPPAPSARPVVPPPPARARPSAPRPAAAPPPSAKAPRGEGLL